MSESQRLIWLLSMPACADVNIAKQNLTGVMYHTSDQHKERNPFSTDPSLRSITTGVVAGEDVNADKAKEVGEKALCSMLGKNIHDHSFRKKDQVETLASKSAVRFSEGSIQVDPQLLFQRLTVVVTAGWFENPQAFFKFEMCSYMYPSALFNSSLLRRQANKPALADAIRTIIKNSQTGGPTRRQGRLGI